VVFDIVKPVVFSTLTPSMLLSTRMLITVTLREPTISRPFKFLASPDATTSMFVEFSMRIPTTLSLTNTFTIVTLEEFTT
jgi:hypothetical protein